MYGKGYNKTKIVFKNYLNIICVKEVLQKPK